MDTLILFKPNLQRRTDKIRGGSDEIYTRLERDIEVGLPAEALIFTIDKPYTTMLSIK